MDRRRLGGPGRPRRHPTARLPGRDGRPSEVPRRPRDRLRGRTGGQRRGHDRRRRHRPCRLGRQQTLAVRERHGRGREARRQTQEGDRERRLVPADSQRPRRRHQGRHPDLLARDIRDGVLYLYRGRSDGTFGNRSEYGRNYTTANRPLIAGAADADRNGTADIGPPRARAP
ncbi:FG-GAP repeat domain-containing protein [Streptomyces sp. NPDC060232]|uniref:FG-GAP repeat domain-containing protein n=1 Tax=Streptomyces sp. NPDC060232 TaxID=3347079 RepID=UPI0036646920